MCGIIGSVGKLKMKILTGLKGRTTKHRGPDASSLIYHQKCRFSSGRQQLIPQISVINHFF